MTRAYNLSCTCTVCPTNDIATLTTIVINWFIDSVSMGDTRWDKRDLKATVLASALVRIL